MCLSRSNIFHRRFTTIAEVGSSDIFSGEMPSLSSELGMSTSGLTRPVIGKTGFVWVFECEVSLQTSSACVPVSA